MRFRAFHGVGEQEHVVGNDYVVSVKISYPLEDATRSDRLDDTLNYAEAYDIVRREMEERSVLLERVAGRIAERLTSRFPKMETVEVDIRKCNPPIGADCDGAGVHLVFANE